jgi:hypothetical protein
MNIPVEERHRRVAIALIKSEDISGTAYADYISGGPCHNAAALFKWTEEERNASIIADLEAETKRLAKIETLREVIALVRSLSRTIDTPMGPFDSVEPDAFEGTCDDTIARLEKEEACHSTAGIDKTELDRLYAHKRAYHELRDYIRRHGSAGPQAADDILAEELARPRQGEV